ncbi:MAG: MBL fold metallo-hydrolase [Candidatus Hydrogenedentes bacterium]|nr:MBL fold metallo-hydrolase [Candidatus Hydrogenedentota bacterium]
MEARKSAAGIILSQGEDPRVLLATRSRHLRFAAGQHVFPGGSLDAGEVGAHVVHAANDEDATHIHAAAREIFEETGLLCAPGPLPPSEAIRAARRAMHDGAMSFDAILERFSLRIDAREFTPAGQWVTPIVAPIRFDTRYYVYHFRGGQHEEVIEGEITALEWMRPVEARARWRTLPPARHTNCVVIGERELLIIDPGPTDDDEQEHLLEQIGEFEAVGARVKAIILTHSHIDHVGAAQFLRERLGAPIWAHEAAVAQLIFPVDGFLTDGQVIEADGDPSWRLRCLFTPGHDPGHLCLLEETTRTLIAGDMVANPGTIIISVDVGGDMTSYLDSLERLLTEEYSLLIPSHGMPPPYPKDRVRKLIEHRLNREEKLKGLLAQGLSHLDELVAAVYDDVNPDIWPLARHSLHAHLHRLGHFAVGQVNAPE